MLFISYGCPTSCSKYGSVSCFWVSLSIKDRVVLAQSSHALAEKFANFASQGHLRQTKAQRRAQSAGKVRNKKEGQININKCFSGTSSIHLNPTFFSLLLGFTSCLSLKNSS